MPAPLVASAVISAIPAVMQMISGASQKRRAQEMSEGLERPDMKIPQSAIDALTRAKTMASTFEMPGYSQAVDQINQVLSTAAGQIDQSATSSSEALGAILNASGQAQGMMQNLGAMSAQDYANRQNTLMSQENQMANWEQMLMNDQMNKFSQESAAAAALGGAGMQNMFSGVSNVAGSAGNAIMYNKLLGDLKGGQTGGGGAADALALIKKGIGASGGLNNPAQTGTTSMLGSILTPTVPFSGNATEVLAPLMNYSTSWNQ